MSRRSSSDDGCLGVIVIVVIIVLLFKVLAAIAILCGIGLLIYLMVLLGKYIYKRTKESNEKNFATRKEAVVTEIGNKISHKKEIQQAFDKHFEKIERQFSLVALISSCMGNNNQELKNLLNSSKETAFKSTKKEIFSKLSVAEQKKFPECVDDVVEYKKTLERESAELTRDLNSVACANEEYFYEIMQRQCPEMYRSIKRKKRNLITAIVVPTIIIIVSSILLSSGFALNLAKGYHLSVLEEKLAENELTAYSITTIDYEKQYKSSYDDDGITTYDIKDITLRYENDFSNHSEDELKKTLRQLYRNLNVSITYRWAQHNLSFEIDKYDYNIILIDRDGDRCSYDGDYFDIDK